MRLEDIFLLKTISVSLICSSVVPEMSCLMNVLIKIVSKTPMSNRSFRFISKQPKVWYSLGILYEVFFFFHLIVQPTKTAPSRRKEMKRGPRGLGQRETGMVPLDL